MNREGNRWYHNGALFLSLLLGLVLLDYRLLALIVSLSLEVLIIDRHGLIDLGTERGIILEAVIYY